MPLDPNIILQARGVQLDDPMETATQAMNMRQLALQNRAQEKTLSDQKTMSDILKRSTTQGPDGKSKLDKGMALSELYKANPEKAMAFQKQIDDMDLGELKKNTEMAYTLAWQATPENYGQIRQKAMEMQLPNAEKIPEVYSDQFVKNWQMGTLSGKEQVAHREKMEELESRSLDRKEARDERRFQAGIKMDEKRQGLKTPFGLANTEDDAKKLKDAFEQKGNFDRKLEQMISLREKHKGGAILDRDDVARGKQLSKDLLLQYKDLAKLGVLSVSDENILNQIIPEDPLQYNSPVAALQGQDPTLHRLKSFQSDANSDFNSRVNTRTRAGIDTAASPNTREWTGSSGKQSSNQDQQAVQWAMANQQDPRAKEILKLNGQAVGKK